MISIIIPQLGETEMTQRLVTQINRFHRSNVHVIVVDDQPEPKVETVIVEGAEVVRNPVNGLTNAWKFGARCANDHGVDTIIFLNNDVECRGEFAHQLAKASEEGMAGVRWRHERSLGQYGRMLPGGEKSLWLEGWAFAVCPSTFHRIGGFDSAMKLYFSDLDIQVRCRMAGLTLAAFEGAPLSHVGHVTTKKNPLIRSSWGADRQTFIAKHWGTK